MAESFNEVSDLVLCNGCRFIFHNAPHRFHHLHEVCLVSDTHAQVSIVVAPLSLGNLAILVTLDALKAVKEIFKHLLTCLLAIDEVLIATNIKDYVDILDAYQARSVLVHECKGFVDNILSPFGER